MIEVRVGSLHDVRVDAILRPVSSTLEGVTVAGREVDLRIGDAVRDRLRALGTLPVGGAVVTPGGDLGIPYLIHVAVQSADEPVSEAGIARGLLNGLRRAMEWEIESVCLPPMGTGAGNLDAERAATLMVPLLRTHLASMAFPSSITIVVPGAYEQEVFTLALARGVVEIDPDDEAPDAAGEAARSVDEPEVAE